MLVYLGLIASLVAMYRRSLQTKAQNAVAAGIVCIFILNPMLQHQIEIFPTNFLFGAFLGCAIFWLGGNLRQEDTSGPESATQLTTHKEVGTQLAGTAGSSPSLPVASAPLARALVPKT